MHILDQLVAIPSESEHEENIVEFIVDWLKQKGVHAFIQGENAVGFIKGSDSKKALILNGHVDTVPAGDASAWTYGPYTPTRIQDTLYGLGASDMKAGVAGILLLAEHYAPQQPPCDIWFSLVAREEIDGRGTESFLEWFENQGHKMKYTSIQGIIAEPTNCEFIGAGHRGNYFASLVVDKDNSLPDQHIYELFESLSKDLKRLENQWKRQFAHPMLGEPTIGLTAIHINNYDSAPSTMTLDIRTTPDLHSKLEQEMNGFLATNYKSVHFTIKSSSPVGWCEDNTIVRQIFSNEFPELPQQAMTGSTDLCFFSAHNIPCVIFGPGQRESMHSVNESFELGKLDEFHQTITSFVQYYGDTDGKK